MLQRVICAACRVNRTVAGYAKAGLCGVVLVLVLAFGAEPLHARPMGYDGHLIAFDRDGVIYLMNTDGSGERPITAGLRPVWAPATDIGGCQGEPPTAGVLAFESTRGPGGDADIYRLVPPSGSAVSLTEGSAADDTAPAWAERSDTGPRLVLAYTSATSGGPRDIWVMDDDPATDDRVNLTNTPGVDERNPDWSSNGAAITFERSVDGISQIWVMQLATGPNGQPVVTATYPATSGPEPKQEPSWVTHVEEEGDVVEEGPVPSLQHGDRIAYAVQVGDFTYIDVIEQRLRPDDTGIVDRSHVFEDLSQTTVWPMTGDPGDDASPSWSPQAGRMLLERRDEHGNTDIYVVSSERSSQSTAGVFTGVPVRLTNHPAADLHPDWRAFQACADMIPRPPRPARHPRRRRRFAASPPAAVAPVFPPTVPGQTEPIVAPPACTITGTRRNDRLRGTPRRDVICGGAGRDRIAGLGGNDIIRAGPGNDIVLGGSGDDEVVGATGNDDLRGERGRDRLLGGRGRDRLDGGPGPDVLSGGAGRDLLIARGGGADRVTGGPGRDTAVVGGAGDVVRGVERRRR